MSALRIEFVTVDTKLRRAFDGSVALVTQVTVRESGRLHRHRVRCSPIAGESITAQLREQQDRAIEAMSLTLARLGISAPVSWGVDMGVRTR